MDTISQWERADIFDGSAVYGTVAAVGAGRREVGRVWRGTWACSTASAQRRRLILILINELSTLSQLEKG
jgi:hypothetical protein